MLYAKSTASFYSPEIHASIPSDAVEISDADYSALMQGQADGRPIVWDDAANKPVSQAIPAPTPEQQLAACTGAIQVEMDKQARAKGYDNIISACSYAAQAVGAPFQAEGAAFLAWRSQVWQEAYAKLAQVQAGTATIPTPAEALAAMPTLVLPS